MWLRITAYAISWTFDMMSHPGQPQLATRCRRLLFRLIINILRCLRDHIQGPEGPDNRYTGLSSAKSSWLPYHRDTCVIILPHFFRQKILRWNWFQTSETCCIITYVKASFNGYVLVKRRVKYCEWIPVVVGWMIA